MTRLSVNARPFAKTASYAHQTRRRVSFLGVTAARSLEITREGREKRLWSWSANGPEGRTLHTKQYEPRKPISKIKEKNPVEAVPFAPPPFPLPDELNSRLEWRKSQNNLARQTTGVSGNTANKLSTSPEKEGRRVRRLMIYALTCSLREEPAEGWNKKSRNEIYRNFGISSIPCCSANNLPRQIATPVVL